MTARYTIMSKEKRKEQPIRTFDEVFRDHRLSPEERKELVYRLAALRAQRTIESLLDSMDCPEGKL